MPRLFREYVILFLMNEGTTERYARADGLKTVLSNIVLKEKVTLLIDSSGSLIEDFISELLSRFISFGVLEHPTKVNRKNKLMAKRHLFIII
jgi:hypothetical protein